MKLIGKKITFNRVLKYFYRKIIKLLNKILPRKQCYICKKRFFNFNKYKLGAKSRSAFLKELDIIGSDVDNFGCPFCNSHDRERHLFMYFDKLNLWKLCKKRVLHIAPERNLYKRIKKLNPIEYTVGDIELGRFSYRDTMKKIDITNIPCKDGLYDLVIACHVLEHIRDYKKAFKEIFRVLKEGGIAILQTPYSSILKLNFEDPNICNDYLREKFYGEPNHYRVYGEQFFNELNETGLKPEIRSHNDFFSKKDVYYYGVNEKEPLMIFRKKK